MAKWQNFMLLQPSQTADIKKSNKNANVLWIRIALGWRGSFGADCLSERSAFAAAPNWRFRLLNI